jgi:hypothetical protein
VFTVTTAPEGTGAACAHGDGDERWEDCYLDIDCVGVFQPVNCSASEGPGYWINKYTIIQEAQNNGTACPHPDGYLQQSTNQTCFASTGCKGSWSEWSFCCGVTPMHRIFNQTADQAANSTNCTAQLSDGTWVALANGAVDTTSCSIPFCPVPCQFEVLETAECNTTCTVGSHMGYLKGQVSITMPALYGGSCPHYQGEPAMTNLACDACCDANDECSEPVYGWVNTTECLGLCHHNKQSFTWALKTNQSPPPGRHLLSTPQSEKHEVGTNATLPCAAKAGFYTPANGTNAAGNMVQVCRGRGDWRHFGACVQPPNGTCNVTTVTKVFQVRCSLGPQ